jgi:hypothetical protein
VVVASVAGLSLGIGFAPSLLQMVKLYRRRNDQTLVVVRVPASEPKVKSGHAGIRRLKKLNS